MKFELFVARRYLWKGKKRSFISVISWVSIIGITIGVAALVIALSLISGFQNDIRNKILGSTAHLMVNHLSGDGFDHYTEIIKQIKQSVPQIKSASPVVFGTVLLRGSGRQAAGVILRGVDIGQAGEESWLKKLVQGHLPTGNQELLIGEELANRLNLMVGENCLALIPETVLTPTGLMPKLKKMTIAGIFKSGLYEIDNGTVITSLPSAQKMFNLNNKIHYIQIYLQDLFAAETLAQKLKKILPPGLGVITWKDLNASLYSALKLEKTILFFTLSLIIIVASLNIIAGLILLVIQKIRDIGILLAYGATPKTIQRIFFIQGSVIGVLGTCAGVLIGVIFCGLANHFELIRVPVEIYQMNHVPFRTNFWDLAAIILISLLISFTATLFPAHKAASVNVVEAVKNE